MFKKTSGLFSLCECLVSSGFWSQHSLWVRMMDEQCWASKMGKEDDESGW